MGPADDTAPRNNQPADAAGIGDRLRGQIRKLVLMKETGPKSAAWHRARVQAIWRLHRQAEMLEAASAHRDQNEQK